MIRRPQESPQHPSEVSENTRTTRPECAPTGRADLDDTNVDADVVEGAARPPGEPRIFGKTRTIETTGSVRTAHRRRFVAGELQVERGEGTFGIGDQSDARRSTFGRRDEPHQGSDMGEATIALAGAIFHQTKIGGDEDMDEHDRHYHDSGRLSGDPARQQASEPISHVVSTSAVNM